MSGSHALPRDGESADDRIGTVIDKRYRIEALIGRGGMGSVYRAEHVTLRRPLALKLLHPNLGGGSDLGKRFEREAFAAGRLVHPNCVQVSDFGQLDDGTLYLAMELLEGESVGSLLQRAGRLPVARALGITRHVLRGLAHAHERDIVHRDIKPENVIVVEHDGDRDFAKVLDFGIAKLIGEAEAEAGGKLTRAGVAFGTPLYMSPEQAWGQPVDRRADLYATTVMLFEMVTGQAPFQAAESVQILTMHATRPPPRLADVAPDVPLPPGLEELVARGLQKERESRFDSATDFIAALEPLLEETTRAPAAPPPGPAAHSPAPHTPVPAPHTPVPAPHTPVPAPTGHAQTALSGPHLDPMAVGSGRPPTYTQHPTGTGTGYHALAPRRRWGRLAAGLGGGLLLLIIFAAVASTTGDGSGRFDAAIEQLHSGETCQDRKRAVERLRSLGDSRAIPALRKARYRMRGGVAGIGAKNENGCLRKAAEKAIRDLERR